MYDWINTITVFFSLFPRHKFHCKCKIDSHDVIWWGFTSGFITAVHAVPGVFHWASARRVFLISRQAKLSLEWEPFNLLTLPHLCPTGSADSKHTWSHAGSADTSPWVHETSGTRKCGEEFAGTKITSSWKLHRDYACVALSFTLTHMHVQIYEVCEFVQAL